MALSRRFADFSNQATRRNAIINGKMDVWQRGTSFTSIGNARYSADRWLSGVSVTPARYTITRSTDVPTVAQAGTLFSFAALCTVNVVDVGVSSTDSISPLQHIVEGFNFRPIAQQPMVLSFWVKSSLVGIYCIAFRNSILDRSYVAEYTINLANTWEYKEIRISSSPIAGTWNYTTGIGLMISFMLMSGTAFQTTPNTWQTGDFRITSNQVNHTATFGNTFRLTGVQLETGNIATPIEYRTFQEEIALCQRYFEKTYNYADAPGTITDRGSVTSHTVETVSFTIHNNGWNFAVPKRTNPTVVVYSPSIATPNRVKGDADGNLAVAGVSAGESRVTAVALTAPAPSSGSLQVWTTHYTADAEL
ncbi:MAG: hypothetical protein ACREAU_00140 [Nitrosopumilaceae archaeon]